MALPVGLGLARTGWGLGRGVIGAGINALRGTGGATRTGLSLVGGAVVADNTIVPFTERVTGLSVPTSGWTRDALTTSADQIAGTLGETWATFTRSAAEGGVRGLLQVDDQESGGLVTVALLVIGAVVALNLLRR